MGRAEWLAHSIGEFSSRQTKPYGADIHDDDARPSPPPPPPPPRPAPPPQLHYPPPTQHRCFSLWCLSVIDDLDEKHKPVSCEQRGVWSCLCGPGGAQTEKKT